ncbi:MAG: NAD(P)-dependent alcohol dehydrogenase [Gammaproteobacteria bacterium]|nr:MAG: NAD(P)-dependent alcohol dehydrogenase [Gammaproteobacteria bacterium]
MSHTRRDTIAGALSLAAASLASERATAGNGERSPWQGRRYRRWEIGPLAGPRGLRLVERRAQAPGPGQVLVEMRAAALNHRDLMIVAGRYGRPQPPERVPLSDGAGVVVAVGPGVTDVAVGDRVTAPHFLEWLDGDYDPAIFAADLGNTADGWLSELVTLPAQSLLTLPDGLDFSDAAALGAAGITAWTVLVNLGRIKAGDTVLTLGTGGVSILALQIAKMFGAKVAITSSSNDKLDLARRLGADITVNYRERPDWEVAVREANDGHGVDIVVETVGVATLGRSLACCAPNARIGLLGALGGQAQEPPDLMPMLLGNLLLKGITSGSRRMFADLLRACGLNGVKPHIDRRFDFDEARAAWEYLAGGGHVGKLIVSRGA